MVTKTDDIRWVVTKTNDIRERSSIILARLGGGRGYDQKCLYCVCNISISRGWGSTIWENLLI